jgi:hypothetical protein
VSALELPPSSQPSATLNGEQLEQEINTPRKPEPVTSNDERAINQKLYEKNPFESSITELDTYSQKYVGNNNSNLYEIVKKALD